MKLIGLSGTTASIVEKLDGTIVSRDYTGGVLQAGGLPVIVPTGYQGQQIEDICDKLDGLLLTGGVDVNPAFFREDPLPNLGMIDPERDDHEFQLVRGMMSRRKPILAICRGLQVLNVALGGSLYQDIPKQVKGAIMHSQKGPRWYLSHRVDITPNTKLAQILGTKECRVNSYHHQAIKELAPGLIISAKSPDGVIEAVEHKEYPFMLAVQWHPENLWERYPVFLKLFESFIEAIPSPSR